MSMGQIAVGQWNTHLSYNNATEMVQHNDLIYAGTESGLFEYNKNDNSITSYSTQNRLSSSNITSLAYYEAGETLLVGYDDGDFDLFKKNQTINLPYIKMANILSSKTISNIFVENDKAYLSCQFGLVIIDLINEEVIETCYFLSENGNAIVYETHVFDDEINAPADTFLSNKIFVATSAGLFYTDKNNNLVDPQNWRKDSKISFSQNEFKFVMDINEETVKYVKGYDLKEMGGKRLVIGTDLNYTDFDIPWSVGSEFNLFEFNTSLYLNESPAESLNEFQVNSGVPGKISDVSINSSLNKAVVLSSDNFTDKIIVLDTCGSECLDPNSFVNVLSVNISDITDLNGDQVITNSILISSGYIDDKTIYLGSQNKGLMILRNTGWGIEFNEDIIPIGPLSNVPGKIAKYGSNIIFSHGSLTSSWNNTYSAEEVSIYNDFLWSGTENIVDSNLYDITSVIGNQSNNEEFFVGTWNNGLVKFENNTISNIYNSENSTLESISDEGWVRIGGLTYDSNGYLWMTNSQAQRPLVSFKNNSFESYPVPYISSSNMSGQIMFTNNNQFWIQIRNGGIVVAQIENNNVSATKISTSNGLASQTVNCFAEDNDGVVWVGTAQGLSVCYNTSTIIGGGTYSVDYILVETDDGYVERLFENTNILDIHVDPANRKWVGTNNNGVFLISEDGSEEIYHFTEQNSPLLNNRVSDIYIDTSSGEVFFSTDKGICSFRSDATRSEKSYNNVMVYPNPVYEDYNGEIVIAGLKNDTNVKISDIAGNIVYETYSNGGTATWNGKNFDGKKVKTGVYLFLCVDEIDKSGVTEKVLIYR